MGHYEVPPAPECVHIDIDRKALTNVRRIVKDTRKSVDRAEMTL